jgi:hypothetical protein
MATIMLGSDAPDFLLAEVKVRPASVFHRMGLKPYENILGIISCSSHASP